jgi:very-short-patch-repair endonuclease
MRGKSRERLERERGIAELADRQHGVVALRQLLGLGFGRRAVEHRVAAGRLHPVHRGVYAVGHTNIALRGKWMAAALAHGDGAVLSHRSAAALWGIARQGRAGIDVTSPRGRCGRPGIALHECRLDAEDLTVLNGIPVTTVARTLFDLSEIVDSAALARAWEEADRLSLLRMRAVLEVIERGRGRHALKPIRPLAAARRRAESHRSPLEDRFARFCDEHRLPPRQTNALVLGHEVDVYWPSAKLVVELDGFGFHGHRTAFERDRARDLDFLVEGIHVIRITHRRLDEEAGVVAEKLRGLLARS